MDRRAVLQALRYKKGEEEPSAYTLGVMRAVACGAPRMQEHLFSAGQVDSARCPWCWEEVDETREHCYYHCKAWAAERMEHLGVWALCTRAARGGISEERRVSSAPKKILRDSFVQPFLACLRW